MKTAVIGSRSFTNYTIVEDTLDGYDLPLIISGGAIGADSLAERYAEEKGIPTLIFKPDYEKYGKSAPILRNKEIIDAAERVIAFWDGKSRGTAYTIKYALQKGLTVHCIPYYKHRLIGTSIE
ncbi:DUF2493 domain-containing protein [Rhodocytophaga aerolata]|uniref:DUF2493 domain-containing protein n=1 Tax=Rhodocytophaga aerolata TaxID=455078 RepID=A0ABT8RG48_9BACT|nr:DUF2493 domain-containing protein [Rhodocytophaga aerolata]MDO1451079.1 DUF2493 domain-containing protein [Rhodocytophaga aerolata]